MSRVLSSSTSGLPFSPLIRLAILGLTAWGVSGGLVQGDAIVVNQSMKAPTIAEIFVEPGRVRVELEIGIRDFEAFRNTLPGEILEKLDPSQAAAPLAERFPKFFEEDWVLKADGETLVPTLESIQGRRRELRDEITGEPLSQGEEEDEAEPVVSVILNYAFDPPRPPTLSLRPPVESDGGRLAATVGFVLYHEGQAVNDFRYLGLESTVDLDWEDPWYSRFRHPNLKRQYDDPLRGFLYAEPFEVRKEIIARPRDLENWIDLDLEDKKELSPEDQAAILEKVGTFLSDRCPVTIDGKPAAGTLDRIHFVRRSLRRTSIVDSDESIPAVSATIGAIFVYPTTGLPQEASMTWDLFTHRTPEMTGMATDEAGGLPITVTPEDPVLTWKNYLKNPTVPGLISVPAPPEQSGWPIPISLILAAGMALSLWFRRQNSGAESKPGKGAWLAVLVLAGLSVMPATWVQFPPGNGKVRPANEEATSLIEGLLTNVYRSFDYRTESDIYDALDQSVHGGLLTEVYLDVQRALQLENQGGAKTKVKEIEILTADSQPAETSPSFRSRVEWTVLGTVGHWGHIHQRKNRYQADLTIEPVGGVWKLTGLELLGEERL